MYITAQIEKNLNKPHLRKIFGAFKLRCFEENNSGLHFKGRLPQSYEPILVNDSGRIYGSQNLNCIQIDKLDKNM